MVSSHYPTHPMIVAKELFRLSEARLLTTIFFDKFEWKRKRRGPRDTIKCERGSRLKAIPKCSENRITNNDEKGGKKNEFM